MYSFVRNFTFLFCIGLVAAVCLDQVKYGAIMHHVNFVTNLKVAATASLIASTFLLVGQEGYRLLTK